MDREHSALTHACAAATCLLLLLAVGQPIVTDDLWWHLALGRAFGANGPWLGEDPLLFAPAGPPATASWLADIALAGTAHAFGFHALRALHVAIAAAILALVWSELRSASGSRAIASVGTLAFASLSAFRLLQLRPDLVSIAATLLCYRWLLADERPPSWRRIAAVAALFALWANLHAVFPIALLLIGAAAVGLLLAAPLRPPEQRRGDRARAGRLACAMALSGFATLANPAGIRAHLVYFAAGRSTPSLERVRDDWAPLRLFELPVGPQPSMMGWLLAWGLALGLACLIVLWLARARKNLDPAKLAISLVAMIVMFSAVRFLWLGIFPLLLFADIARAPERAVRRTRWAAAAACLLAAGFVKLGESPRITRGAMVRWSHYQQPYAAAKHYAHAIWLLADSGVHGRLYNDYFIGGFAGYWLSPDIRSIANGSLNVTSETLDALHAIALRKGLRPGESFTALLDRLEIDLFMGIRIPEPRVTAAAGGTTTAHLENTPGWIPIFRNFTSALYLRVSDRNRANIDRLARYYAQQGVPFDAERGFDVDAVIRLAPDWAVRHGVIPDGFAVAAQAALTQRASAEVRDLVAAMSAVLGRYERSIAIDRKLLREEPQGVSVRRRLAWALLQQGHLDEAASVAQPLGPCPTSDSLSCFLVVTIREARTLDADAARALAATTPFLTIAEGSSLKSLMESPAIRPAR